MLNTYMNIASPFGAPVDVNHETVLAKLLDKPSVLSKSQKVKYVSSYQFNFVINLPFVILNNRFNSPFF